MLPLALDGVSLAALSRVQPYVAAVGEAGEEVSAMLAAVGVPRPDKRELPHMRVTDEGLGPRTVGEVAPFN